MLKNSRKTKRKNNHFQLNIFPLQQFPIFLLPFFPCVFFNDLMPWNVLLLWQISLNIIYCVLVHTLVLRLSVTNFNSDSSPFNIMDIFSSPDVSKKNREKKKRKRILFHVMLCVCYSFIVNRMIRFCANNSSIQTENATAFLMNL